MATLFPTVTHDSANPLSKMSIVESKTGELNRAPSSFRKFVSREPGAEFPAEAGRYHLYICYGCPWASRCLIFLKLKGLEDVIGLTATKTKFAKTREDNPADDHYGWAFPENEDEEPPAKPDTLNGAKFIRDLYDMADPNASGRYTVPVLWDKTKKTIVNNESSEIMIMFNNEFNEFAKHPEVDLFPAHLKSKIDEVDAWTYNSINNGVYRAGFATKQKAYEEAATDLFAALDKCEEILSKQRYIAGNDFTGADVRLFVTFIRFDEVYHIHCKCNRKAIREYPNLFNYTKDIYQIPKIKETVKMDHIKSLYFSQININRYGIEPLGPNIDYSAPHDRHRFSQ